MELSEQKLVIRGFKDGILYEDEPIIAIEETNKGEVVKAIGANAKSMASINITISNPFKHSRSFIGDFYLAEKILQHGVYTIHKSFIRPAPRVIMHQLEKVEGGLTNIEERVLRELACGAGAREVLIYTGSKINTKVDTYESIKARVLVT